MRIVREPILLVEHREAVPPASLPSRRWLKEVCGALVGSTVLGGMILVTPFSLGISLLAAGSSALASGVVLGWFLED